MKELYMEFNIAYSDMQLILLFLALAFNFPDHLDRFCPTKIDLM